MKAAAMDDPGPEEGHALTTSAETDISFFKMALSHLRSDLHAKTTFLLLSLKLAENNFFFVVGVVVVVPSRSNKRPQVRTLHSGVCLLILVTAGRRSLKSLSMHNIACVCGRAGARCFIFHAHKEMCDKMATVCPASLLDLNVCAPVSVHHWPQHGIRLRPSPAWTRDLRTIGHVQMGSRKWNEWEMVELWFKSAAQNAKSTTNEA